MQTTSPQKKKTKPTKTSTNKTKGRVLFLNMDKFPHLVHHTASTSSCTWKSDSANQNETKQCKVEAVEANTSPGQKCLCSSDLRLRNSVFYEVKSLHKKGCILQSYLGDFSFLFSSTLRLLYKTEKYLFKKNLAPWKFPKLRHTNISPPSSKTGSFLLFLVWFFF